MLMALRDVFEDTLRDMAPIHDVSSRDQEARRRPPTEGGLVSFFKINRRPVRAIMEPLRHADQRGAGSRIGRALRQGKALRRRRAKFVAPVCHRYASRTRGTNSKRIRSVPPN
jgi:hypothetical protein